MTLAAIILAAGQGTRFNSDLPKVLHRLGGQPLVRHAVAAVQALTDAPPVLVVGHGAEQVRAELGDSVQYALQAEQLGTGHAVQQAAELLRGRCRQVLVTYGDMPLLRPATLRALVDAQRAQGGGLSMLTIQAPQLRDFGRVVRDGGGRVRAVVEAAQATPAELEIPERNAGAYCFEADWLWEQLPRLPLSPKGEYYLTDLVAAAAAGGEAIASVAAGDDLEVTGINTRAQLAEAEAALRRRVNERWLAEGVTLIDPAATYIEPGVRLGRDTVVWPNTCLQGQTEVGAGCVLGPNTIVRDTRLGERCQVECSVLEGAWLGDDVHVGPFAHLRAGARLEDGVHMGNFGEVKNSTLGPGVKMGHFSYIGDAQVGAEANIGAGTITCNFDGVRKNPTRVGAQAFIGSDTLLVAPVVVGEGARTGAGSVVTRDVPADSLAVGVPARVIRKLKKQD